MILGRYSGISVVEVKEISGCFKYDPELLLFLAFSERCKSILKITCHRDVCKVCIKRKAPWQDCLKWKRKDSSLTCHVQNYWSNFNCIHRTENHDIALSKLDGNFSMKYSVFACFLDMLAICYLFSFKSLYSKWICSAAWIYYKILTMPNTGTGLKYNLFSNNSVHIDTNLGILY